MPMGSFFDTIIDTVIDYQYHALLIYIGGVQEWQNFKIELPCWSREKLWTQEIYTEGHFGHMTKDCDKKWFKILCGHGQGSEALTMRYTNLLLNPWLRDIV